MFLPITTSGISLPQKGISGHLETTIFRKPTAGNSLLRWESFHPPSLKRGIPKGQYLRARRNCSDAHSFKVESNTLLTRFANRGYPKKVLSKAFKHAASQDCLSLLNNNVEKTREDDTLRIISTFDTAVPQVRDILDTFWPILKRDPYVAEFISEKPAIVFRRGRSVGDFLVHSHYTPPPPQGTWLDRGTVGTYRCGTCKACKYILKCSNFTNPITGIKYNSRSFANCKTSGVVYVAICPCPCIYVGKTIRELRRRILEHIGDIHHKRDTSLAKHMTTIHPDALYAVSFWVLEVVKMGERRGDLDRLLLQKETGWIFRLKSSVPRGLNDYLSFTSFL